MKVEKIRKLINTLKLKWLKETVRNNYSYCGYYFNICWNKHSRKQN